MRCGWRWRRGHLGGLSFRGSWLRRSSEWRLNRLGCRLLRHRLWLRFRSVERNPLDGRLRCCRSQNQDERIHYKLPLRLAQPSTSAIRGSCLNWLSHAKSLGDEACRSGIKRDADLDSLAFRPALSFIATAMIAILWRYRVRPTHAAAFERAYGSEGDFDPSSLRSNLFELEWPPRSGRMQSFPEVDRAEWFAPDEARAKILPGQRPFIDRLLERLGTNQS